MSEVSVNCACGSVKVEVLSETSCVFSAVCHCSDCRSITGSPFFWGNGWPMDQIKVTGETVSHSYIKNVRYSCAKCGSFMYEPCPDFGITMLPASRLENPTPPMMHVYVKSAVYQLPDDGIPRFDEMPPPQG